MDRKMLLIVTVFVEGGLIALGWVLAGTLQVEIQPKINATWSATACALLLCIPLLFALYFVDRSQLPPVTHLRKILDELVAPIFSNCKVPDLAMIALLAGAGEELFFRGWLQTMLVDKFDVWLGILMTSLIFGLVHYLSTGYAVYAFLTGLYLGVIFLASGNLYLVMVIHAVYDFIALVYLVQRGSGRDVGLFTIKG